MEKTWKKLTPNGLTSILVIMLSFQLSRQLLFRNSIRHSHSLEVISVIFFQQNSLREYLRACRPRNNWKLDYVSAFNNKATVNILGKRDSFVFSNLAVSWHFCWICRLPLFYLSYFISGLCFIFVFNTFWCLPKVHIREYKVISSVPISLRHR